MSLRINHNGSDIYGASAIRLTGRAAVGSYGFVLGLTFHQKPTSQTVWVNSLWCSISLADSKHVVLPRVDCSDGPFSANSEFQQEKRVFFEFTLTAQQLETLEAERGSKDLHLSVGLRFTTQTPTEGPDQRLSDEVILIPREDWLVALNQSGFRKTILFEMPVSQLDTYSDELIAKAWHLIDTGYYRDAVMQCRHLIEHIEGVRGDGKLAQAENKKSSDSKLRKEMSIEGRMLSMREHVKNICQLGAHGDEHFTRSQAKAVLAMTIALLSEPTVGFTELTTRN